MSRGTGGQDAGTGADQAVTFTFPHGTQVTVDGEGNVLSGGRATQPPGPEMPAPKVEYGLLYSSGGFLVRNDAPYVEKIYPLEQWIWNEQQHGKVWRRTIIVLEDWHEVPR